MKRFLHVLFLGVFLTTTANAQSGRVRTKSTTGTETKPIGRTIDPNVYTESRPFKPIKLAPNRRRVRKKQVPKVPVVEAKKTTGQDDEDEIISIEASLVTVPVTVFDKNGIYIPHIGKHEFKIFEDGVEQEITYFGADDQPFTVALVIDTSGSTQFKIEDIRFAARAFVRQLEPRDKVIVISFASGVRVRSEVTNDKEKIYRAIDSIGFGGGTALYDAVEFSLKKRMRKIKGRKAIVLFTDGVDTGSRDANFRENLEDAEESDSLIYPVYYNTFLSGRSSGTILSSPFPGVSIGNSSVREAKAHTFGKHFLEDLAAYTGGRVFHAGQSRSILVQAFEGVAEELRSQYVIGYSPSSEGEKGERKRIKVRVYRGDIRVRARDSYIVGERNTRGN